MKENNPHDPKEKKQKKKNFNSASDNTAKKEDREDLLTGSSATDARSDEKVIVNEQRGNKTVNIPSQTAVHTSEGNSYDDEIIN